MNIASQIPKNMHATILRKLLTTFPTDELKDIIVVIEEEQHRRYNEKNQN